MRTETAKMIHVGLSDYKNMGNGPGWIEKDKGMKEFSCSMGMKVLQILVNPELSKNKNFSKNVLIYTGDEVCVNFKMCVKRSSMLADKYLNIEYESPKADVERDGQFYKTCGNMLFKIDDNGPEDTPIL